MTYDVEEAQDLDVGRQRFEPTASGRARVKSRVHSKDLEAIITLLELAALTLTTKPDSTFTYEELLAQARELAGDDIDVDERDVKIVLEKASFLKKSGGRYRVK